MGELITGDIHEATGGMGYLFEWSELAPPNYVREMSRERFLEALSINLVEAGDKIRDLPQNNPDIDDDTITRGSGSAEAIELIGSVLADIGSFPKDIESLRRLRAAIASAKAVQPQ